MTRQVVLLAAGTGSRLAPLTDSMPKCLVRVGSTTILDRMLSQLADAGVERAVIVTGHKSDRLMDHLAHHPPKLAVKFAYNPHYATSNNAVSLQCAHLALEPGGFILCDADVVLRRNPFKTLQRAPGSALLVDPRSGLGQEEMKAVVESGRVLNLSKELDPSTCYGESIGIQKIGAGSADAVWRELDRMMEAGRRHAYYEEAFQNLINQGHRFGVVPIETGSWTEIDDLADLEDARVRFAGD